MSKLVYGKNGQLRFESEEEKAQAIRYILESPNVDFHIHENNQEQGAWGPEDRIHFRSGEDVPACLLRNMTAGKNGIFGRINCGEFCEELRSIAKADSRRKD